MVGRGVCLHIRKHMMQERLYLHHNEYLWNDAQQ
jgi:hypothetical protein